MARGKFKTFFLSYILAFIITASASPKFSNENKRDYIKNHYYAIQVLDDSLATPIDISTLLDITYEGPVGELSNYYLFSSPKSVASGFSKRELLGEEDIVMRKWKKLKAKRQNSYSLAKRSAQTIDGIVSIQKQSLRRRHKRVPLPPPPFPPPPPTFDNYPANPDGNTQPSEDDEKLAESLGIFDPGFRFQWHLHNNVQRGNDINVTGVWQSGVTGKGVVVALVDDGLDMYSEDLKDNFFAEGSYDFNDHSPLPKPRLPDDQHGTRCAGEIAAVRNNVCGVGIAYDAKVSGIRILSAEISDVDEATALNYHYHENHIYSCSWGPADDGQSLEAPHGIILDAMVNGVRNGRDGKGSLYVFASGNGGINGDSCNFDGYTNSIYTITVGAIERDNEHPAYSEECSALLITAYSSGGGNYIYTTDVGPRTCSNQHGGTSAAAPIAAGILALALEIRPDLTWRDVQYLALQSAVPFNLGDDDWSMTAAGRYFSHRYGYGKIDAYTIVENAKTFVNLGPQVSLEAPIISVNKRIPNNEGILNTFEVSQEHLDGVNFGRLEHVAVTVNIDHTRRGDVEVDLISPRLIRSKLAVSRQFDTHRTGFANWTFMSVKHWGESPIGGWTIQVRDRAHPQEWGTFLNWTITFWGEKKKDPSEATTVPQPIQSSTSDTVAVPTPTSKTPITTSLAAHTSYENSLTGNTPSAKVSEEPALSTASAPPIVNETSPQSNMTITYAIIGTVVTFVFAGFVYYVKRCWNKRNISREGYEFAVLSEDDGRVDDMAPLGGGKQFMTSREVFAAFGDSDDDDDGNEKQVVYDNVYMDAYTDAPSETVEDEDNTSETVVQGESSDVENESNNLSQPQQQQLENSRQQNGSWDDFSQLMGSRETRR